jgi:hypothetical protein
MGEKNMAVDVQDDKYPWKVRVEYPWKLVELASESLADPLPNPIPYLIGLDMAAQRCGGRRYVCSADRHYERRGISNVEDYEFAEARKADSFIEEAMRILDKCDSPELRQAIAKDREAVVGRQYSVRIQENGQFVRRLDGEIGRSLP